MKKPRQVQPLECCPYCGEKVLSVALHVFACPKIADLEGEEGEATKEWVRRNEAAVKRAILNADNEEDRRPRTAERKP